MDAVNNVIDDIIKQAENSQVISSDDYYNDSGLLVCGICNTEKQCRVEFLGVEKVVPCVCKCEKERIEKEKQAEKDQERLLRVQSLRKMGFPESNMQEWTFANDDMANERVTNAMQRYVDNFTEFKKKGKGLLLYGNVGTGKTFAACEVANALIDKGYPALVTNFARLINTLQGTFEKQEYIDSLNEFDLLVIDDLATERNTDFMNEQVHNIIDNRYRAGLPMIITTNLTINELKSPNDIAKKRVYDRVLERCFPIEIAGQSRRRKNIQADYNETKALLGL